MYKNPTKKRVRMDTRGPVELLYGHRRVPPQIKIPCNGNPNFDLEPDPDKLFAKSDVRFAENVLV
jgi:hypothetical protein